MKKITAIFAALLFGMGLSYSQVVYSAQSKNDDSEIPETMETRTSEEIKRDHTVDVLVKYVIDANYKGINHDGVYTMTAENVIIYLAELAQYEPFKTFRNQMVATYYILNKASIKQGLEPVYSFNGEFDPDKWPLEVMVGSMDASKSANGYRRAGVRGFSSFTDTITYHDEEEQRKYDEKAVLERAASEKKKVAMLEGFIENIKNTEFDIYRDYNAKRDFLASVGLVEVYSRNFNNLLPPSFNTEAAAKYVMNIASVELGYEPVYSVNGETDPEKWNIARYKIIDESKSANGYKIADVMELSSVGRKNTQTGYVIVRYDEKIIAEESAKKAAAGKAFLESIGLVIEESKSQNIALYYKNNTTVMTDENDYKIFSLVPEKKSKALSSGIKQNDLFVIHGVPKASLQGTTKIILDTKVIDLSNYGNSATIEDVYSAFGNAASAKKIIIQVRRKSMGSYDLKEITIKK